MQILDAQPVVVIDLRYLLDHCVVEFLFLLKVEGVKMVKG